jgi:hypothetical protein
MCIGEKASWEACSLLLLRATFRKLYENKHKHLRSNILTAVLGGILENFIFSCEIVGIVFILPKKIHLTKATE